MSSTHAELHGKGRTLALLALAELLGMSVWFSASAVLPALTADWHLGDAGRAGLTMAVQLGFVIGALTSSIFNLADRWSAPKFFCGASLVAAVSTALVPLAVHGLWPALVLRFVTGASLAGVYPVGMKIMTTWTKADRGLGIGLVVGAVTIGTSAPHGLQAIDGVGSWQALLYAAAGLCALGGILALAFLREGPYRSRSPRFDARYVREMFKSRELVLANVGYLGHMWELYAMWAWVPLFLRASFAQVGRDASAASWASFAVIAAGAAGSVLAGKLADRHGRTTVAITALAISGACSLAVGFLYGGDPVWLVAVCLVWGFAVVADSAQFSACVSELCRPEFTGTALTVQTSLGFLLTLVTIRLIPTLEHAVGWRYAFAFLALGPFVGAWAMWTLRRSPAARKLAGGRG